MLSPFQFLKFSFISYFILILFILLIIKMNWINKFIFNFQLFEVLIFCLILMNFFGLLPYFWSLGCYFTNNIFVSLLIWGTMFFSFLAKFSKLLLSNLLPFSAPLFLWFFLIITELLSQFIRPLTLSLRLMCNLIAGHVMINLLNLMTLKFLFLIIVLIYFEMGVAMIQSIVYSLLNLIYFKETI
uniref:ATP synthase subunit a n=1 Tax=Romanomermis culicivorax TaxID=13658 RepID=A1EHF9_ROMCU|nr:ATP synthase F0 subunit 6 [Romanomermis culicivorax]ABL11588.1 ATP synthase F0 subunit 6 [Romanomermis culicivorax]